MSSLRIAENIMKLRKQKGITQEELANFLGVTKASVSKWENGQSMPDIILLPEIATYFDVTVDRLMGYEPQLSKEQIQKLYGELGEQFAQLPFEEAFAKSEAYLMNGEVEKADTFTQASMYLHLLLLVADSTSFLTQHMQEREVCEETIQRTDVLIETYHIETLNPNVVAGYDYYVAAYKASYGDEKEAMRRLRHHIQIVLSMMEQGMLHGDSYFNRLDSWFEELDLGGQMPRSKKLVLQSVRESLENPIFDGLRDKKEYEMLKKMISE